MRLIEKILMPSLEWIQLEVSGLCNASCFYCPHTTHKKQWQGKNFSFEDFLKIVPFLKKVKLLYLQGWGEPFLNPDFFKFVEVAKTAGCLVGTTTNGMLIKETDIEKILNLDLIAFSLTGIKKNDILRQGTSIEKVLKTIEELNHIKKKNKADKPKIHIAYLLLRSNFDEINLIADFLSSKGIDHVVVSILDFIPDDSLADESLIPKNEQQYSFLKEKVSDIVGEAKKMGLKVSFSIPHPFKKGKQCSEKPLQSIFINSLGYVSPCVFTGIPSSNFQNLYFGNLKDKSLLEILRTAEYKDFKRKHLSETSTLPCIKCPKMRIVQI